MTRHRGRQSSVGERDWRSELAVRVGLVEHLLYAAVAIALIFTGIAIFAWALVQFIMHVNDDQRFDQTFLELLDAILLVFIVVELLHTIRTVIAENVLQAEPFLVVGIVAALRRVIVISAEASDAIGQAGFRDLMLELGLLVGSTLALGITIFLLRHGRPSGPPSEERHDGLS